MSLGITINMMVGMYGALSVASLTLIRTYLFLCAFDVSWYVLVCERHCVLVSATALPGIAMLFNLCLCGVSVPATYIMARGW